MENNNEKVESQINTRINSLNTLVTTFGYGHVIHNFKNYVLRGQDKYRQRIQNDSKNF
jgi:methyl-accepting chemotaxis protein